MILDGIAGFKFLLAGQFSHFIAVLRAHKSFYAVLPATLQKRKELVRKIKHYTTTAVYLHCIVFDFYVRRKRTFKEIDFKERFKA